MRTTTCALLTFVITFLFFAKLNAQTTTTILGPKKYFVTNQNGSTYTENINRTVAQTGFQYKLTIKNADGADHPIKNCSGLNLLARLACQVENALQQAYVNLLRVNSATISINNTNIVTSASFNKNTKSLIVPLSMQEANQLKIALSGPLLSFIDLKLEATSIATDSIAPSIQSNLASNSLTRNPLLHISVIDTAATTTIVKNHNLDVILNTSSKEFDITLSEGLNTFFINSTDAYGNQSQVLQLSNIRLDTTSPILSTNISSDFIYNSYPQTVTVNITSDEDLQSLTVNNFTATMMDPRNFQYLLTVTEPQTVNLSIKGFDEAGNESLITRNINFGIDNIAPVISSTRASNSFTNISSFDVTIVDNSNTTTQVFSNGVLTHTTVDKTITLNLNTGVNTFRIKSEDQYGNVAQDLVLNITYDITPPVLTQDIQPIYYQAFFPDIFDFHFTSNERLSLFVVNGQSIPSADRIHFDSSITINQANGNSLNTRAVDLAGNVTLRNYPLQIIFDNQAPQIFFIGGVPNITSDETFMLNVQISDQIPVDSKLYVNGTQIATINLKNFSYLIELPTDGNYEIKLESEDLAGNHSQQIVNVIKKDDMIAPTITHNVQTSYTVTSLPNTLEFQFTANEPLKSLVVDGQTLTSNSLVYTYQKQVSNIGSNDITLFATDMSDNVTTITYNFNLIFDNTAPIISIAEHSLYTNQNSMLLSFEIVETNTAETEISINGNYLATISQKNFSYLIDLPTDGIYNVSLTSTDYAGNSSTQSTNITKDSVLPVITTNQLPNTTYATSVSLVIDVNEVLDVETDILVNNVSLGKTSSKSFTQLINMPIFGAYNIDIISKDKANNIHTKNITINRIIEPLSLTVTSPLQGAVYSNYTVQIGFHANRSIAKAYVNNVEVPINEDQVSVNYQLQFPLDGLFTVNIKVEDSAGSVVEQNIQAEIVIGSIAWNYQECPLEE